MITNLTGRPLASMPASINTDRLRMGQGTASEINSSLAHASSHRIISFAIYSIPAEQQHQIQESGERHLAADNTQTERQNTHEVLSTLLVTMQKTTASSAVLVEGWSI